MMHQIDERLESLGKQAKERRLSQDRDGYEHAASRYLKALAEIGSLPVDLDSVELMYGGRVNYLSAAAVDDNGRKVFLKITPGKQEAAFYRGVLSGNILSKGELFFVPDCYEVIEVAGTFIFVLQHVDDINDQAGEQEDEIRIAGLAEFSASNLIPKNSKGVTGLPRHRLYLRENSIERMQAALGLEGKGPEVLAQRELIERWACVHERLQSFQKALCVRDAGRGNVAVSGGMALFCDCGAMQYGPMGFDLWCYVITQPDVNSAAERMAATYTGALGLEVSAPSIGDVVFVAKAAGCIMALDVFVGNSMYGNRSMIEKMQLIAQQLIEECS